MISGKEGKREIKTTEREFIYDVEYTVPISYQLKMVKSSENKIVLAFSGGPDPDTTPAILDLLKQYDIKASFFITGKDALKYPELVKRIYEEGHELGNIAFTKMEFADLSEKKLKVECNLTQYLLEVIIGHRTHFYQLPDEVYNGLYNPAAWTLLREIHNKGYILVDGTFNPVNVTDLSKTKISEAVWEELENRKVMTFSGTYEDNNTTLAALPGIIDELQQKGYQFLGLSDMLQTSRDEVMPVKTPHISLIQTPVSSGISLYAFAFRAFQFIWPFAMMLGALRFIFFIIFSLRHKKKHEQLEFDDTYSPSVSVLVAAYNEEVVICNTLAHLLRSGYENFEILVVDDGSTDDTYEVIRKAFETEKRVKLLRQKNKGKIAAVNYALENATGDIVITVDADTLVTKDAVNLLSRHVQDPKVAAVAGNIRVTNLNKIVAVFQHIEYLYSFNLERRAYSSIHANIVVPGCNGAWRKSYLMEAGMFTMDTIAEDTDVPIAFLEKGYKVIYEEKALAYTEVPDTIKDLFKQRVRWYFGIIQVLWKNKKLLVKAKNKCVQFLTLTNAWIYGIFYQLLVPVVDVMILLQLYDGTSRRLVFMYFLLMLMDFGVTVFAFRLEKESLKPLLWFVPMKIFYRYFMFFIIILSCINAFKGKPLNWNKLKRLGATNAKASI